MRRVAPVLLAFACSGPKEPPPTTPEITPPAVDTATDTATEPEGYSIDAAFFYVDAFFAFDDANDRHVTFARDGTGLKPIEVVVTFADSSAAYSLVFDETTTCSVSLEYEDGTLPIASWVEANGAWTGFDLPAAARVRDGCVGYGLPQEFMQDAGSAVARWPWGLAVGPLDPYVEDTLRANLPASEWAAVEPYIVGGALKSPWVTSVMTGTAPTDYIGDLGYALGYQVDGNFEIVVGGTGELFPLPKETIDTETGVTTGYYEIEVGFFGPGSLLTY